LGLSRVMRSILTGIGVFAWAGYLHAQQVISDTTIRQVMLQDVIINQTDSGMSEAFTFYRTGKLAGTEDLISRIEGVNLIKRGAFGNEPVLRAYSAGQINITLNGMKIYGACTDKMDPPTVYVEPGNLQKVQVTQGASGSLMGSSIGGHLNMQLKEASFQCHYKPIVTLFGQYATVNNAITSGATVNLNNKVIALRINTTIRSAHDYKAGGGVMVEHSGFRKINMHMNGVILLPAHQKLLVDYIVDQGRDIGYPALIMDVSKADMQLIALTYRKEWLYAQLETRFYYNTVAHMMDDTQRPETVMHMDMPGWSYTAGAYSQLFYQKSRHRLQVRMDGHRAETRADMTMYPVNEKPMYMQTLPGNILHNIGGSFSYRLQLGKQNIGFTYRVDGYEQYAIDTIGILQWTGFGYNVADPQVNWLHNGSAFAEHNGKWGTTTGTVALGSRLPNANERLGFYLYNRGDGYDYIGKNDLLPESSLQFELKQTVQVKQFVFSVTAFHHQVHNYIAGTVIPGYSAMTMGARGVKTYVNTNALLTGMEATVSALIAKVVAYKANARYTYGQLSSGDAMQQVPPFKLIQAFRYQYRSLQVQAEQIIAASQNRINTGFFEQATPSWSILNLRFVYGISMGASAVQFNLAIENILDNNYREHLNWGGIPQPGRNILVGVNYYLN
jgi:iron complex outermembrane receptor protein